MNNLKNIFIIAEAGVNHNGKLSNAIKMVDIAADSGVDAIKFQSFIASEMLTKSVNKASYQKKNTKLNETQFQMIKKLELSPQMHEKILNHCVKRNIKFLSTPFDIKSLNLLVNQFGIDTIKISSGDITNAPLLFETAKLAKQIILSTGMSTFEDIDRALGVIMCSKKNEQPRKEVSTDFIQYLEKKNNRYILTNFVSLLHCTSEYPTPYDDVNLNVIPKLKLRYSLPVGYSDHTKGTHVSVAAVSIGAKIIEKHFTLDKHLPGPDHLASLNPKQLETLVKNIRDIEKSFGSKEKNIVPSESKNVLIARKFIVANKNIKKGQIFTEENINIKRSGGGISPMNYWKVLGRKATKNYVKDDIINENI